MTKLKDKYSKFYLDNGIKCILYKRREVHSVSIEVRVRVGSFDESEKNSGISHFLEHLAFDGTKRLPTWQAINDYQNSISGSCNAYTWIEHTAYHGSFPSKYLKEALFYYSELVFNPLHSLEAIEKERTIILDERKNEDDDVDSTVYFNYINQRYKVNDTIFKRRIIGTEDTIKSFTKTDFEEFYTKYYKPENTEIYISGSFDISGAKKILNEYFNSIELNNRFNRSKSNKNNIEHLRDNKVFNREFVKNQPDFSHFLISNPIRSDVNQYYLDITFPSLARYKSSIKDRYIIDFINAITASSRFQNSLIYKRLREENGLVYTVGSYEYEYMTRAFINVSTQFNPIYLDKVLNIIYSSIEELKLGKYGEDIFNQRKAVIEDTHLMKYDSPSNVLNWIVDQEYEYEFNGKSITYSEYLNIIKSIKFSEVVEMFNTIYDWRMANINILSSKPINNLEGVVKDIVKIY